MLATQLVQDEVITADQLPEVRCCYNCKNKYLVTVSATSRDSLKIKFTCTHCGDNRTYNNPYSVRSAISDFNAIEQWQWLSELHTRLV